MARIFGDFARAFFLTILLATATCATFWATPATAQVITIQQIVINGNQRVEDATILAYAEVSIGQTLSAGEVNAAG